MSETTDDLDVGYDGEDEDDCQACMCDDCFEIRETTVTQIFDLKNRILKLEKEIRKIKSELL